MGDVIRTSHAGSLPRPDGLIELNRRRGAGEAIDEAEYAEALAQGTVDVVRRQRDIGIDLPNDGEYGHAIGQKVDYGAWWSYIFERLGGLGMLTDMTKIPIADPKGTIKIGTLTDRRDWNRFSAAYFEPVVGIMSGMRSDGETVQDAFQLPVCEGPLTYVGQEAVQRDVANLKAAMQATGTEQAFMCSIGPASCSRIGNTHYATDEEFVFACAEAMREEYLAITGAGLIVQIDEPSFAESWDQFTQEPTLEEYRTFTQVRIEALNQALRGIPRELVRFHCCWGSWHGPHSTDLELEKVIDLLLTVEAGSFSFEAANARHEHEWRAWEGADIPDDVVLVPGVVGHATNVIEHPQLVADRIERFARIVGADRVIAATDCGLGGRVHEQIAWAKLEALAQGAELAAKAPAGA
jgi:5-methyltetrahydropteroyltriglutamate--homocysteine methyltransferase